MSEAEVAAFNGFFTAARLFHCPQNATYVALFSAATSFYQVHIYTRIRKWDKLFTIVFEVSHQAVIGAVPLRSLSSTESVPMKKYLRIKLGINVAQQQMIIQLLRGVECECQNRNTEQAFAKEHSDKSSRQYKAFCLSHLKLAGLNP